jgi:hypothetical protein
MMASENQESIWRARLEELGVSVVLKKLDHAGPDQGSTIPGLHTGGEILTRAFVERWIAQKESDAASQRESTLLWAKIAGVTSIVAIFLIIAQMWLAR